MNKKLLIILLLLLAPLCYSNQSNSTSYAFQYHFGGESFPVKVSANDYESALEDAATQCFNHFSKSKGNAKVRMPEDKALDLIDECTNPKRIE